MRHLDVLVPPGKGKDVLEIAGKHGGINLSCSRATTPEGDRDHVEVNLPNIKLEGFIGEVDRIHDMRLTLMPGGVIPMHPPGKKIAEQAVQVTDLSPIEVYLSGLQSIGSWTGFLGYAVTAGVIAWTGMFTNSIYLLIAAMLIAPFAGPAMNAAIGTARGDLCLLGHSIVRYVISLLVAVIVAAFLSFAFGQIIETNTMISISKLSSASILLPLAAGAAGAFNLISSERNSLVSGAAVGLMVSVSLAPPAAMIGMAMVIGRWDLVDNGLFSLLITIFGINLGSMLIFRWHGLTPRGARYPRGKRWVFYVAAALTIIALLGLLTWQFYSTPGLQRSTREERANMVINKAVEESGLARFVEANVRFTEPGRIGGNVLLANVYVEKNASISMSTSEVRQQLTGQIDDKLLSEGFNLTPLIDVTVLERPQSKL
jgi:uncharacterized hydrophobic protein (TIGR00341 family)